MNAVRCFIGGIALLLNGCTHLPTYEVWIKPEQLDTYTTRALEIYATPTNWLAYGADSITDHECIRALNAKPWFMVSGHNGGTLGDDPYVTVCIPVHTADSNRWDEEFVGVTFHHPTGELQLVGVGAIGMKTNHKRLQGNSP